MLEHTPQHSADLPPPDSDPEPGIPCVQTPDPESELANWKALAKLAEGASNDAISEREAALKKADRAFATIQHLERLYAASRKNTRLMWLIGFLLGTGITASVLSFF